MKKNLPKTMLTLAALTMFFPSRTWAFSLPTSGPGGSTTISGVLNYFLNTLIYPILSVFALGSIVWGGVLLMSSQGDEAKVKKARTVLMYGVVGVLLIVLSYAIIQATQLLINSFI